MYAASSRKRSHSIQPLSLTQNYRNVQLTSYKYLGVVLAADLSWSPHLQQMCNKTRKLIILSLQEFLQALKSHYLTQALYTSPSFVSSLSACAAELWDAHHSKNIKMYKSAPIKYALKLKSQLYSIQLACIYIYNYITCGKNMMVVLTGHLSSSVYIADLMFENFTYSH